MKGHKRAKKSRKRAGKRFKSLQARLKRVAQTTNNKALKNLVCEVSDALHATYSPKERADLATHKWAK